MENLAHDLDHLEKHLETFGSVVAKVPDVWGQARMTKHRQEFEQMMFESRGLFKESLQGSLARSDQAYFANAFALGMASQPRRSTTTITPFVPTPQPQLVQLVESKSTTTTTETTADKDKAGKTTTTVSENTPAPLSTAPAAPPAPTPIPVPAAAAPATSDFDKVIARPELTNTGLAKAIGFGTNAVISLEPTELLQQKARYLNYLDQIRRTNEGDDTADSPGYSLNLMRIPVSLLPGKRTESGYGAEVTCTLAPVLGDELLPMTFRNLLINDIVKHISFPLAIVLNDETTKKAITSSDFSGSKSLMDERLRQVCKERCPTQKNDQQTESAGYVAANRRNSVRSLMQTQRAVGTAPRSVARQSVAASAPPDTCDAMIDALRTPKPFRDMAAAGTGQLAGPSTKSKRARLPYTVSQANNVFGYDYLYSIASEALLAFHDEIDAKGYAHLPDVRAYLQDEVAAAHKFLSSCENQSLWQFCTPELACAVRTHNYSYVNATRMAYFEVLVHRCDFLEAKSLHAALGWAIIVEAALLNERLVEDMRESASAKGGVPPAQDGLPYFLPNPPPEAREAFNNYVRLRWPIHVFALDPMVEEQNIADSMATRREMQLALSLAFASGRMNANNMTKFARRLEAQYETISLNRTQVGFSHGEDTFGWRFYPRYQTPDTQSNLTVFFRDQLIGGPGRDALLRQRRLEPGPRECVAIVIMPSFVPQLNCDVNCNWFRLANPRHKELNSSDAMRLSRSVHTIQNCVSQVQDASCYRPGDLLRLERKAEQLSARLPLQTLPVQVPYENTLGGFEMFTTGVTDLAPELIGWYGAPGIDLDNEGTTLFLVGDHFSVHQTRVIAGNRDCGTPTLLSRQVAMIKVPKGVMKRDDDYVELQVATPYGVTQTIAIPAIKTSVKPSSSAAEGFAVVTNNVVVAYKLKAQGDDKFCPEFESIDAPNDKSIRIRWDDALGAIHIPVEVEFAFEINGQPFVHKLTANVGKKELVVPDSQVEALTRKLIEQSYPSGPKRLAEDPLRVPIKTKAITIQSEAVANRLVTRRVEVLNPIEFEFRRSQSGFQVVPCQPLPMPKKDVSQPMPNVPANSATPLQKEHIPVRFSADEAVPTQWRPRRTPQHGQ